MLMLVLEEQCILFSMNDGFIEERRAKKDEFFTKSKNSVGSEMQLSNPGLLKTTSVIPTLHYNS